ncbi:MULTISPECIES: aminoacyl-tRNA hydrolase [Methylomonas]|uniref:Peptidyl-tRNA hydrolase n=2 Tax=Methylomonas TaxID=416 RepID=A0A126T6M0_9GAMM|nr:MULTISPECIES: aminoacyl-tRNA hydrolase [Methylomonas]AMK77698.1 peptidyl-tRNA hydrolase [Methylomonas denitrificans]OAH96810.1 aminoacyl-tRNA hydrolase [Methylomonas methanica]TCV86872.1 peptidyl-tRNA hydrolase [Methylomonas methanica]
MIKLIVGLGNPGRQYEKTRHNAGFLFVEYLAGLAGAGWSSSSQFSGEVAECNIGGFRLMLLKPMTFMNKSGMSVGKLLRYYKLNPEEMLVVHDDLELPESVVKLKRDGGHGGHNGLRDIITHIDSRDFYRLRVGIGRPLAGEKVADYVLSGLSLDGQARLLGLFEGLAKNMEALITGNFAPING